MTSPPRAAPPIRVLLVDDSASNQRILSRLLEGDPDVTVVGRASDGEEALREALRLRPDAICLDLQMPRMDGFTFLRLLMARQPTAVIVVSSYAAKASVFKALELGALDFIAKPEGAGANLHEIGNELRSKIRTVRALRIDNLSTRASTARPAAPEPEPTAPLRGAVVGASTGGPPAVQRLLAELPAELPMAVLVAQHMPERFTRAFAERVGRLTRVAVSEAEDGDLVTAGRALVAPGGRHLSVEWESGPGSPLRARVLPAERARPYCPSIDLLFESAARAMGPRACGVVLTGMGNDGRRGIEAIKAAGGLTVAESERTAVVYGMPREAAATGRVDEILPLDRIGERLARFGQGR